MCMICMYSVQRVLYGVINVRANSITPTHKVYTTNYIHSTVYPEKKKKNKVKKKSEMGAPGGYHKV